MLIALREPLAYTPPTKGTLIGFARCSTDKQDLAAQKEMLVQLGVEPDRIYSDRGLTGTTRLRPGLAQALAAVRSGDTLVVPKHDRLARSVPDARDIADMLLQRGASLLDWLPDVGCNAPRVAEAFRVVETLRFMPGTSCVDPVWNCRHNCTEMASSILLWHVIDFRAYYAGAFTAFNGAYKSTSGLEGEPV